MTKKTGGCSGSGKVEVEEKVEELEGGSYRSFVKYHMKRRPAHVLPKDYMKTIGIEWKKHKGSK